VLYLFYSSNVTELQLKTRYNEAYLLETKTFRPVVNVRTSFRILTGQPRVNDTLFRFDQWVAFMTVTQSYRVEANNVSNFLFGCDN